MLYDALALARAEEDRKAASFELDDLLPSFMHRSSPTFEQHSALQ